jgi:DNA-binding HxlR family transcriptional regulator
MKFPFSAFGLPLNSLLRVVAGRWTIYIPCCLYKNGEICFGQFKRQMVGISSRMLTEYLRTLEQAEIIYRHQQWTFFLNFSMDSRRRERS